MWLQSTFDIFLISIRAMYSSLLRIPTVLGYMANFSSKTPICLLQGKYVVSTKRTAQQWNGNNLLSINDATITSRIYLAKS